MRIGVAKADAGISLTGKFQPLEKSDAKDRAVLILKGHEYYVPDTYDFNHPGALFVEKVEKRKESK
jgi:hypothetical protein